MGTTFNPLVFWPNENILLSPLATLTPGSTFLNEANVVSLSLSYSPTGGSFSISLLKGYLSPLPLEDVVISLPFGRVGIVKQAGSSWSSGGLVDVISGPILPQLAVQNTFYALLNNQQAALLSIAASIASASASGSAVIGGGSSTGYQLFWLALSGGNKMINFSYRGPTLQGIQQVASIVLGDVIVRKDGVYVVNPGDYVPSGGGTGFGSGGSYGGGTYTYTPFSVGITDIVSASQNIDYTTDVAAILNPALLTNISSGLTGDFVYDNQHCQKQPKFTVACGAPGSSGSTDFIPIPDGWLVDGSFEEWQITNPQDTTNTNPTVPNGRYWKTFPSPSNPGFMRGITDFTRLIKEIKIAGNVSAFVASPITGLTKQGSQNEFQFDNYTSNNGLYGFDSGGGFSAGGISVGVTVQDIISDQYITVNNACILTPQSGANAGAAYNNFYHIDMEIWTFPRVNPITFTLGPSINPFAIPNGALVVTPNQSVVNGYTTGYYANYLKNYRLINSPRLKTNITVVYRDVLPQVGDQLTVTSGLTYQDCGRIQSVSLNYSRSGVTIAIAAEKYQFISGKWNSLGALAPGQAQIS